MKENPTALPPPEYFLAEYLDSGRAEPQFTTLVDRLGGLVFSSAFRRTGDQSLSEEISQNVFAILARKAASLQRHKNLSAWIFQTTKLESAKAMRTEYRRKRKIAALASEKLMESTSTIPSPEENSWDVALPALDESLDQLNPNDRDILISRFFEKKKFAEIASSTGKSEAACKMRVKRALQKLAAMLSARGVALSTTVIASALGTELARSAPLQFATAVAPKALAVSSSISTTNTLTNTLLTMTIIKTNTLTAAVVLAVLAIPFSRQFAEGSRIRSELRATADEQSVDSKRRRISQRSTGRITEPRTARSLLASVSGADKHRALIGSLITEDSLEETLAWGHISEMSQDELKELLDHLQTFPCDNITKDVLSSKIGQYLPGESPLERLERMLAGGRYPVSQAHMQLWAGENPNAALAWYREKRASGKLDPGLNDELHQRVLTDLLVGLAKSNPTMALEVYREMPREETYSLTPQWVASELAKKIIQSGDDNLLANFLELQNEKDRKHVLTGTLGEFARSGEFDRGMALLDKYNTAPEERNDYIEDLFRNSLMPNQLKEGLDWVLSSTPEAQQPRVMRRMILEATQRWHAMGQKWVKAQAPGPIRDIGHAALADRFVEMNDFTQALTEAENIERESLRSGTQKEIGRSWLTRDREKAEQALPADLLEQLLNQ